MVTVRTTAANFHHHRSRHREFESRIQPDYLHDDGEPLLRDDHLVVAFRSLSDRWRKTLWWSEIDGLTPVEIGQRLGISPGAAAALTYRARRALRAAYTATSASS